MILFLLPLNKGFRDNPSKIIQNNIMVNYCTVTNKATGNPYKANATHVWTQKNRKVICFSRQWTRRYSTVKINFTAA